MIWVGPPLPSNVRFPIKTLIYNKPCLFTRPSFERLHDSHIHSDVCVAIDTHTMYIKQSCVSLFVVFFLNHHHQEPLKEREDLE